MTSSTFGIKFSPFTFLWCHGLCDCFHFLLNFRANFSCCTSYLSLYRFHFFSHIFFDTLNHRSGFFFDFFYNRTGAFFDLFCHFRRFFFGFINKITFFFLSHHIGSFLLNIRTALLFFITASRKNNHSNCN